MARIVRTSAGLRDALFDAIEKLGTGDIDGQQAQAMATLAKQICNTVQLEIEVARLRTEYPADSPIVVPKPLNLGIDDVPAKAPKAAEMSQVQTPLRRLTNAAPVREDEGIDNGPGRAKSALG